MLKLYDGHGHPVCGFCGESHRSKACKTPKARQFWSGSSRSTPTFQGPAVARIESSSSNLITQALASRSPTTNLQVLGQPTQVLIDTGAEISCIHPDTLNGSNVDINMMEALEYANVNGLSRFTLGTVNVTVLKQSLKFHIVPSMKHAIILGWDAIQALKGLINSVDHTVTFCLPETITLPISPRRSEIAHIETTVPKLVQDILSNHSDVIATNPKCLKVTNLVTFTIDTGDHEPIFIGARRYHRCSALSP